MQSKDFKIPENLSPVGLKAVHTILGCLAKTFVGYDEPSGGGCRAFYSPSEWDSYGETYGLYAELIVVHDGGDLAPFFNYTYEAGEAMKTMCLDLEKQGLFAEQCTGWYTAIYEIRR